MTTGMLTLVILSAVCFVSAGALWSSAWLRDCNSHERKVLACMAMLFCLLGYVASHAAHALRESAAAAEGQVRGPE